MLKAEITKWSIPNGPSCVVIAVTDGWNHGAWEGLKAVPNVIMKIFIDVGVDTYGTNS